MVVLQPDAADDDPEEATTVDLTLCKAKIGGRSVVWTHSRCLYSIHNNSVPCGHVRLAIGFVYLL